MLFAFLAASFLGGLFVTYIWSSNGFTNCAIKAMFTGYTAWAFILLLGHLWPMIVNGTIRLI